MLFSRTLEKFMSHKGDCVSVRDTARDVAIWKSFRNLRTTWNFVSNSQDTLVEELRIALIVLELPWTFNTSLASAQYGKTVRWVVKDAWYGDESFDPKVAVLPGGLDHRGRRRDYAILLRTAPSGMVLFFDQKLDRTAAPCPAPQEKNKKKKRKQEKKKKKKRGGRE